MKKINLIFGTHNHQPIGNFDFIFEDAHDRAYKPFLDVFEKFPDLKIAKHYTGILYDWLFLHRPELMQRLSTLVKQGRIELISGGFYEPILAVIPDEDKTGQIEKLTKFIKKKFGYEATGLWLAERIWEQHLTKPLAQAGIEYVILDDTHFKYAGLSDEALLGYYITEEQGRTVNLFPISKQLRYTIPFQDVEKTIDYLRSIATEAGDRIAVFADDGEKFGVWPDTFEHVYKNRWLERFFQALTDNQDWIRTMTFKEALHEIEPIGRIYLPNASYAEMMHWSLPTVKGFNDYDVFEHQLKDLNLFAKNDPFVRGGFWRNFMVKYPESNNMHKKMLEQSMRAQSLISKKKKVSAKTLDKIWAAQCNCPYWHGVFGGTYLANLRHPIYTNLIEAETELDKVEKLDGVTVDVLDFDRDGKKEIMMKSATLGLYINPFEGGKIFELDYKPAKKNILDIVSRREEGYHQKLRDMKNQPQDAHAGGSIHDRATAKETGLEDFLNYDRYRRGSLIEHFVPIGTTLDEMYRARQTELGDFITGPFAYQTGGTKAKQTVTLTRTTSVHADGQDFNIELTKAITLEKGKSAFTARYTVKNLSEGTLDVRFAIENCYGLLAGNAPDRYYYFDGQTLDDKRLQSLGEVRSKMAGLKDEWLRIHARLESSEDALVMRYPIETISLSEAGFERVYQGSTVLMCYDLSLELGKPFLLTLTQKFSRI
ncbi:MAG: DUF1926 domain-containing protein [Rhizobacter sp.]|nr:DUF1926 domain-containing protein [Chlorobiales bacterium]